MLAEVERRCRGEDIILLFRQSLKDNTEEAHRGLETTAVILLLPYLFRDKISPLPTPLQHIGGNPFPHEI
ncbi:hypothetical protein J4Q44_G00117790 [Coregonus suidteri]|uniref:Uncharacterized protein n=1 Tax=Coregonus suidteri TaxID=861788 RepID=A0AAN8LW99_9TELE